MEQHPKAALNFFWQKMERQVRFDGAIIKVSEDVSDDYFKTRPRGSQLGAWVSEQSQVIPSREFLEDQLKSYQERFQGTTIPRPPHWGGYQLIPTRVEFWQGGPNRLHDRFIYELKEEKWKLGRFYP